MILNASGCLDALTAPDVAQSLDAFVTKTVTPLPRQGNQPVRIAETDLGMLNSIGLANPGIDGFLANVLPQLVEFGIPIWVSVGGFSAQDYAALCAVLDGRDEVAVVELNVSCPNVASPEEEVEEIVAAARAATTKTLYAKLSPAVPDVGTAAAAAARAGADGLTLVNTIRGLALDERTLEPKLGPGVGGLSGPALRPIALAAVFTAYRATGLPIVGVGGVETGAHGLELIAAGASAFALGTVLFADPEAPLRVREELEREASARGFGTPLAAYAAAHGGPPPTPLRRVA
jgi:dihydroorotate dehydrogenase (NAD+) catalytic subunit